MLEVIESYIHDINRFLNSIPEKMSVKMETDMRGDYALQVKGIVLFENHYSFHFREYYLTEEFMQKIAYSYHFQNEANQMIFQYDNAEHHSEIETYPHHKHEGREILPSVEVDIKTVIEEVLIFLKRKTDY